MAETLSQSLERFAIDELGFDLFGITAASPPAGGAHLERWIAAGWHGEMRWMAETAAVRRDPGRLLSGARSVICVAASYHEPAEPPELAPAGDRVVVARYARRKDYHDVVKPRLVRLGRRLAELAPGARWRVASDAVPVLEKELAQRAGLGWIGKNTCLINPRLGSEILLGELLTDVPLEPGLPAGDRCGSCTACLEACPSRALPAPYRLDARRCVSYLTIEHLSDIPDDLSPFLGAHLFGCDICQAVCPWNRRVAPRARAPLAERGPLARLSLPALERLDAVAWRRLAAGTPLRRLDYARMRRNLAAVRTNITARRDRCMPSNEQHELLAHVAEIPPGGLAVTYSDGPFEEAAILLVEPDGVRAWRNRCRHLQVRLDGANPGAFLAPGGRHLVCQEHGALYRRSDGFCESGPCRGASLRPLPIVVENGAVYLDRGGLSSFFAP